MSRFSVTWTLLLWIPGSALFGIGWVLDGNGWTTEHGFVTNVLAAATSGLLGLPVAAIIVQWILRQDAESRRRREILRSARRNFAEMQASFEDYGIEKVLKIQAAVVTAAMDIVVVKFAVQMSGTVPADLASQLRASLAALIPIISENLPSSAEDEWQFSSALRRWDVLKETVFSPAEMDGIRVISDEDYATLSGNIESLAGEKIAWLPNLMRDIDTLLPALSGPDDESIWQINPIARIHIQELNGALSSLRSQIQVRADLYTGLVSARKAAEHVAIY